MRLFFYYEKARCDGQQDYKYVLKHPNRVCGKKSHISFPYQRFPQRILCQICNGMRTRISFAFPAVPSPATKASRPKPESACSVIGRSVNKRDGIRIKGEWLPTFQAGLPARFTKGTREDPLGIARRIGEHGLRTSKKGGSGLDYTCGRMSPGKRVKSRS